MVTKQSHSFFHNFSVSYDDLRNEHGVTDLELISSCMMEEQLFVRETIMELLKDHLQKLVEEGCELEIETNRLNMKVDELMGVICDSIESHKECETKETQTEVCGEFETKKTQTEVCGEFETKGASNLGTWSVEKNIEQQVKDVALDVVSNSGYTFDETTGYYYDQTTGYHYNAETSLYYDGKTGTFFYFDHVSESYKFHSYDQATVNRIANEADPNIKNKVIEQSESLITNNNDISTVENVEEDCVKIVAPSLRLMIMNGDSAGNLHLVTKNGGTIGRGAHNIVSLDDESISKVHAKIIYKSKGDFDHHYYIKDCGSEEGTVVNGKRLGRQGILSKAKELVHGWKMSCGNVQFTCHIHNGLVTCNECEPGITLAAKAKNEVKSNVEKEDMELKRRQEVKALRKKYSLEYHKDQKAFNLEANIPSKYKNRAKVRRKVVGSDNPYEKTQIASIETSLPSSNKGFKLLQKMGWSDGSALGKSQKGRIEPIIPSSTVGRMGLGATPDVNSYLVGKSKSANILSVTKTRYNALCRSDVNEAAETKKPTLNKISFLSAGTILNSDKNNLPSRVENILDKNIKEAEDTTSQIGGMGSIKNISFSVGDKKEGDCVTSSLAETSFRKNLLDDDENEEVANETSNGRRNWGAKSHTKKIWTPEEGVAAKLNAKMGIKVPKTDNVPKNNKIDIFSSNNQNVNLEDLNKSKFSNLANRAKSQKSYANSAETVDCITIDDEDSDEDMEWDRINSQRNISLNSNRGLDSLWADSELDYGWSNSRLSSRLQSGESIEYNSNIDRQENYTSLSHPFETISLMEETSKKSTLSDEETEQSTKKLIASGWNVS